jgi:hypothetical protein
MHYQHAMRKASHLLEQDKLQSFDESLSLILSEKFIYSDAFSKNMTALGHEVRELIWDFEPLQKKWAKENKLSTDEKNWMLACTLDQIEKFQPEILYFQDVYGLPHKVRKSIKERFPFIKVVVLHKGFPSHLDELGDFDLIFAGSPGIAETFTKTGHPNVKLLYHSFDGSITIREKPKHIGTYPDFAFIGSTGCGLVGSNHKKRYHTLSQLMEKTDLEVWANEVRCGADFEKSLSTAKRWPSKLLNKIPTAFLEKFLKTPFLRNSLKDKAEQILVEKKALLLFSKYGEKGLETLIQANHLPHRLRPLAESFLAQWRSAQIFGFQEPICDQPCSYKFDSSIPLFPLSSLYPSRVHEPVFGNEMYELLKFSHITFNIHTDAVQNEVANIRMFETTGVGGCLLTDTGRNLNDLFDPDTEVVTYKSVDECVEKVSYLRDNKKVRDEIARAGQKRTLDQHTTYHRCIEIQEHFDTSV